MRQRRQHSCATRAFQPPLLLGLRAHKGRPRRRLPTIGLAQDVRGEGSLQVAQAVAKPASEPEQAEDSADGWCKHDHANREETTAPPRRWKGRHALDRCRHPGAATTEPWNRGQRPPDGDGEAACSKLAEHAYRLSSGPVDVFVINHGCVCGEGVIEPSYRHVDEQRPPRRNPGGLTFCWKRPSPVSKAARVMATGSVMTGASNPGWREGQKATPSPRQQQCACRSPEVAANCSTDVCRPPP